MTDLERRLLEEFGDEIGAPSGLVAETLGVSVGQVTSLARKLEAEGLLEDTGYAMKKDRRYHWQYIDKPKTEGGMRSKPGASTVWKTTDAGRAALESSGLKETNMARHDENDERDHSEVTLYDDEALQLMQGWWSGSGDPLYAIYSMGGRHEAWVFQDAIANLDHDISRVKPLGRGKFQLGQGTFSKKEIDELHTIRNALEDALESRGMGEHRWRGTESQARRYRVPPEPPRHHVAPKPTRRQPSTPARRHR